MSIAISGYDFEGPFVTTASLKDQSGVYAILSKASNGTYDLLDVGESAKVKERVESHDRVSCWRRHANSSGVSYSAYYADSTSRMNLEKKVREQYDPPCGKI
jgi:hypothetical protein